jgi:cystathionine beta-lyase/cystathionine gamma-synthase
MTESSRSKAKGAATRAVRAGIASDLHHGAVVPPIHLSSTFAFNGLGGKGRYDYTRTGNPTRDYLAAALSELEGGRAAVVTSTGMSAVALVLQLVRPGDLVVAAHDCYGGTHRILRSLAARVVEELTSHSAVKQVYYPGLISHPGHRIAASQQDGFGAMVSFELTGGLTAVEAFVGALECFTLAESLGGVESLVAHPASMTHASMDAVTRANAGIEDSLVRLSVGIEDGDDLVADIRAALDLAEAACLAPVNEIEQRCSPPVSAAL